ncbi:MAG TPA: ABC transporter permease, partial [Anaerolineae bacterium]|nr:ABC transporter permease [Anaerolineae bacterium]
PWLAPYPDQGMGKANLGEKLDPPSSAHPLGTDDLGRDLLSRILLGSRPSLSIGLFVVGLAMLIGTPLGAIAGYFGGWIDQAIMRITDIFLSFPALLLAITISAALGASFFNAMLSISLTWWPWYTRLARAQAVSLKEQTFVEASRALGVPGFTIIRRHIIPNVLTPALVQATMDVGSAILMGAALSFVGLGVQLPKPDWGNMLNVARLYFNDGPWFAIFPGLAILLIAMCFNLLGDGVRDVLDPQSRRTG